MPYRKFAIGTLIATPLIVMAVQQFLPSPHAKDVGSESVSPQDAPPPPIVLPQAPPIGTPAPANEVGDLGQPLAGAGQPTLTPGNGLPDTSTPPMVAMGTPAVQATAPAGSPNAE
ncbi:hypothetical protein J3E64_002871 [Sphingobium sp. OAS761]|uniref:hypothetical protein n=1 Tax=Sphingobium sp. OAS761 TaxID=2817901 RepID=UPI0020A0FC94|nr:hypothetical protein [Sphingobium sp. OAS761]MCP1471167.1 hypothetical protein [Sphingobium sp. OAS761]